MLPLIVPAILTDDFSAFKKQLAKISGHFSSAQIDVMDGVFVPNESFSERKELADINSEAYFELHLMVRNPIFEIAKWKEINGITSAIFHIEADVDPKKCVETIKQNGWKAGIAINPETPLEKIMPYINMVDEILFMTVHPGQQGAPFVPEVLEKIKEYKKLNAKAICSVDGGINKYTIKSVIDAGAEKLYIGKAIIQADDVEHAHKELLNQQI